MPTSKSRLTFDDKRTLYLALNELQLRGIALPEDAKKLFQKKQIQFPIDSNGYFIRRDGHLFSPYEEQKRFIAATQRYTLFRGGRGCISGDTKIGNIPIAEKNSYSYVNSLYGKFISSKGYLKGKDFIHLVTTQYGNQVKVTEHHRFLTPSGWLPLNRVSVGDLILTDGTLHDENLKEKSSNFLDDYSLDFRLCGELHDLLVQASLNILQPLHNIVYDNSAWSSLYLLSIVDFLSLLLFQLFVEYSSELISFSQSLMIFEIVVQFLYSQVLEDINLLQCQGRLSFLADSLPYQHGFPLFSERDLLKAHFCQDETLFPYLYNYCSYANNKRLSNMDYLQTSDLKYDLPISVFQSLPHNQSQVSYKFYLMYQKVIRTLYQFDMSFESQEFVEQFLSLDTFSFGDIDTLYYRILQLYKPRLGKYSFSLQYHLRSGLEEFLSLLAHNSQFLDVQFLSSLTPQNKHYSTMRFDKIQSIKTLYFGEYYDLQVPYAESYVANGIYHHNSGKSGSGAQKALQKIMLGESGAVINPVFSDFIDSTWQEFKQWIPWNMVVPSQRHRVNDEWQPNKPFRMSFLNGAFVICKGLKNPESARGPNINWAWYDEGRNDPTGLAWKNLISSVRIGKNPQAWCTTTPVGISHWLYEFFEERQIGDDVIELLKKLGYGLDDLTASFHGSIEDNKENLDPMFYASIMASYPSGYLRDREVFGQYSDAGGKIGDANWFKGKILDFVLPEQIKILRYWDLAATEKKQAKDDPDEMVGSLVSKHKNPEDEKKPLFMVQHQACGYWGDEKALEVIANVARADGPFISVIVELEPGASGKITVAAVKEYFKRFPELQSHTVMGLDVKKVGDRVLAANLLWFSVANEGRMYMLQGSWNKETLKQLDGFTQIKHDDRITSITNAMFILNPYKAWSKVEFLTT